MKNIIVIHGSFGDPYENWIPWLMGQCRTRDIPFFAPCFPSPKGQSFANWSLILDGYRSAGVVNDQSVVIAHSSGAAFFVKYATINSVRIRKLISVSGFTDFISGDDNFDAINREFFFEKGERPNLQVGIEVVSFFSDNDPFLPRGVLEGFAELLHARIVDVKGAGHFNQAAGYGRFDQILEEI